MCLMIFYYYLLLHAGIAGTEKSELRKRARLLTLQVIKIATPKFGPPTLCNELNWIVATVYYGQVELE